MTALAHGDLIAVPELASGDVGRVAWWRTKGETRLPELEKAWRARDLDPGQLPIPTTPATALTRAVNQLAGTRRLSRPLGDGKGRALVIETAAGDDLEYGVTLRAKLDGLGRVIIDPPHHPLAVALREQYDHHLDVLPAATIGGWLVDMVARHDGVRLRDTGGVYFIPSYRMRDWLRMVDAIHEGTAHKMLGVPAMRAEDAVDSLLDALEQEAQDEVTGMLTELSEEELGWRAIENREGKCVAMARKVQRYERLLGRKLDTLRTKIEELHGVLTAAKLAAMPPEDDES